MFSLSKVTVPEPIFTKPKSDFRSVDFPAPFGPIIPTNSP